MIMKSTPRRYLWMFVLAFLIACGKQAAALPPETLTTTAVSPTPIPTSTLIPLIIAPSPLPTQPIIVMTPDSTQLERWREYEAALGKAIFKEATLVLCEWEIVGQSDQEVYVWAICTNMDGTGSVPAVVYLNSDGTVQSAAYTGNIPEVTFNDALRKLFPADVREKFRYIDVGDMSVHLERRRTHPKEPPLIVLSTTPTP
jgi:hypothetical protein